MRIEVGDILVYNTKMWDGMVLINKDQMGVVKKIVQKYEHKSYQTKVSNYLVSEYGYREGVGVGDTKNIAPYNVKKVYNIKENPEYFF